MIHLYKLKLFLTSLEVSKHLVSPFEKLFNLSIRNLKVAFIIDGLYAPNLNTPKQIEKYTEEDIKIYRDEYKWEIDLIRLEKELPDFDRYDLIYVNGGMSGHIMNMIITSGAKPLIEKWIKADMPYVGSSGGSMIMSNTQDVATWYPGEEEVDANDFPGFGLINYQLFPHYEAKHHKQILQKRKKDLKYILMNNNHALSVTNESITLHGNNMILL